VVTADHGAAFENGQPLRGVSEANADSVLWVPLLVKPPGQTTGRIDDRAASTIDVLPTIADVIGLDLPDGTDGQSLLGPDTGTGGADQRRVYDWGFNRVVPNDDGYSLIDGLEGFDDLLAQPPPGAGDDPDLRFHRFGRHADLVGQDVADLRVAGDAGLTYRLDDDGVYQSSAPAQQDAYVAGTVDSAEQLDVAIAVNGRIGGWSETLTTSRGNRFWSVMPPQFLLDNGQDEIRLYLIQADGSLAPMTPQR
jgi:hypothetical protein